MSPAKKEFIKILLVVIGSQLFLAGIIILLFWFFPEVKSYLAIGSLILAIFSAFLLAMLSKYTFIEPLKELEIYIKKFLVGELKNKDFEYIKTGNQSINYISLFLFRTLTTLKNIKSEFKHGKEIKGEVVLAKEIQEKLLGKDLLAIPSLQVLAKSKPAGEIGGDSYDVIREKDNYYIYVGDATGHGVGAGFIMVMVNALISALAKVYKSGAIILSKTNEVVKPRVKANLLMTVLLIRWDEENKKLYMTGAGHEHLIIYKHKLNKCFKVKSGGVALGMIKDTSKILKEVGISFEVGDIAILYSDGITEAINLPKKDGTEIRFGEERIIEAIKNAGIVQGINMKSAKSVFNSISLNLSKFMGFNHIQLDDVTLSIVWYKPENYEEDLDVADLDEDSMTEWKWN